MKASEQLQTAPSENICSLCTVLADKYAANQRGQQRIAMLAGDFWNRSRTLVVRLLYRPKQHTALKQPSRSNKLKAPLSPLTDRRTDGEPRYTAGHEFHD